MRLYGQHTQRVLYTLRPLSLGEINNDIAYKYNIVLIQISIFELIDSKDIFRTVYCNRMSKRLILAQSISEEAEDTMILNLKVMVTVVSDSETKWTV